MDTYQDPCKALGMSKGDATAMAAFVNYGLTDGQAQLGQLKYAKLPDALLSKSQAALKSLTCNGSPLGGS